MNYRVMTKPVDEPASPRDGTRVLVNRIRPSGLCKETGTLDLWSRSCTPFEPVDGRSKIRENLVVFPSSILQKRSYRAWTGQ